MQKIAIPTREEHVDDHFGHCAYYTIFTVNDQAQVQARETLDSPQGCGCKSNIASVLHDMGVGVMLAGNIGQGAYQKITAQGIKLVRGCHGPVEEVLKAYLAGNLTDNAELCNHHDCPSHEGEHVFKL